MKKNYNYTRRKLYLPEYGRHIQEMIDSLLAIEDRRERNRQARAAIAGMGNLNPLLPISPTNSGITFSSCLIFSSMWTRPTRSPRARS